MPEFSYEIPPDYVDAFGDVSINGVMKLFQRAATDHSTEMGYPASWYQEQDSAWLARTHRLTYPRALDSEKPVTIRTEIEDCKKIRSLRSYELTQSNDGPLLASGYTDWVYLQRSEQSFKRIPEEMAKRFEPTYKESSPNRPQLDSPEEPASAFESAIQVQFRDLDGMNHVNNAVYVDYILELCLQWKQHQENSLDLTCENFNFSVSTLNIKYLNQARWNEAITGKIWELDSPDEENCGYLFESNSNRIAEGTLKLNQ
jgi:acyl-CoA thioesterase FadM